MTHESNPGRKPGSRTIRHFVATGFVVHGNSTLLHWHRKVEEWLPPGGHIEPDEDPVQATLREIVEETGLQAQIVPTWPQPSIGNLDQIPAPHCIMIEDVFDEDTGDHQHIDHIYFTRVRSDALKGSGRGCPAVPSGWVWVTREQLSSRAPIDGDDGPLKPPPEDVVELGIAAIDHVLSAGA